VTGGDAPESDSAPEGAEPPSQSDAQLDAQILGLLIESEDEFLTGQVLCDKLGLPRARLLQRIDSLRMRGYAVQSLPGRGYRISGLPDGIAAEQVGPLLATAELGRRLHVHQEIGSTSDEAHRLAEAGAEHGTVVLAESQTAGRGRRGRTWVTPPGKAIALSVILRPDLPPARAPELALTAAVAVCEVAQGLGAPAAAIKWPNDVECRGRKLAGMLAEMRAQGDRVTHVVVGIGLNVNLEPSDLPAELRPLATSLRIERGEPIARSLVCARLLTRFEVLLSLHEAEGFAPVRARFRELSSTLRRRVRAEVAKGFVEGEAIDLAEDGALLVRTDSGAVERVIAGDVEHLRVAPVSI
jgi:BirA family biotin operon repressor/biotin-[acetyl-CoA-carboxylase] ligase